MDARDLGGELVSLYLPNLEGGGAERMMVALARGMSRRGIPVDIVLAKAYGPYLEEVPADVNVVDLESSGVIASLPRLRSYLRMARPTAALGTLPYASLGLLWAARLSGRRLRVFIREASTPSMVRPSRWDVKTRAAGYLSRLFYPRADGVIAVSQGVARDLHDFLGVPEEKVATIYNPVVTEQLPALAAEELRHPWFNPGAPPVLLSVGRLGSEKDFQTLIRAFALVREQRDARLMILGEGTERDRLERLAAGLGVAGDVELPGFVQNPFPYMAGSAGYVLSSEREGLPGSLIQAMACGCPVVSTDCPSGPAEVLEGGRYGRLVPVGDHVAMAEAILATLGEEVDREQLRRRAGDFSEERSLDAYIELLLCSDGFGSSSSVSSGVGDSSSSTAGDSAAAGDSSSGVAGTSSSSSTSKPAGM